MKICIKKGNLKCLFNEYGSVFKAVLIHIFLWELADFKLELDRARRWDNRPFIELKMYLKHLALLIFCLLSPKFMLL